MPFPPGLWSFRQDRAIRRELPVSVHSSSSSLLGRELPHFPNAVCAPIAPLVGTDYRSGRLVDQRRPVSFLARPSPELRFFRIKAVRDEALGRSQGARPT